jgi:hypothetical protein
MRLFTGARDGVKAGDKTGVRDQGSEKRFINVDFNAACAAWIDFLKMGGWGFMYGLKPVPFNVDGVICTG